MSEHFQDYILHILIELVVIALPFGSGIALVMWMRPLVAAEVNRLLTEDLQLTLLSPAKQHRRL